MRARAGVSRAFYFLYTRNLICKSHQASRERNEEAIQTVASTKIRTVYRSEIYAVTMHRVPVKYEDTYIITLIYARNKYYLQFAYNNRVKVARYDSADLK